jgi:very-short-patch-repair endonuclease
MVPKNYRLSDRARELRKNMTPQERKLWYLFLRDHPVKFYRQRVLGPFIVDFYCASAQLVIEIDGAQHNSTDGIAYDYERSLFIEQYNLKILRFTNADVDYRFNQTCAAIDGEVYARKQ